MDLCPISVILLIIICCFSTLFPFSAGSNNNPSHLKPEISINCGSVGISTAVNNGREWIGDKNPKKLASLLQIKGTSTTTTTTTTTSSSSTHNKLMMMISGDPVIYKTARISRSQFLYMFHLNPGHKILRLHFNPTPYKGFTTLKDSFTVEAAQFTLLKNFSASLTATSLGTNTLLTKEFYISIQENQPLNLIFSPTTTSPSQESTYAFVNGIEIIPVIAQMTYFRGGGDFGAQVVGQKSLVYVDNNTALELIHRFNVKHDSVSKWDDYDTVPKPKPNETNVLTWKRFVHVGFRYLIRIHFSELGLKIAETGHLMFKVAINELIVETSTHIVNERHANSKIRYRDYLTVMKGRKEDGLRDVSISLQWNNELIDGDGILKGFEILKVSNPDNSLASPNPLPLARNSLPWISSTNFLSILGPKDVIATIATMIILVISIVSYKLREISEMEYREEENKPSARAERQCRRFSLAEIQSATKNFSDAFFIGRGGFGKVYKGVIDNGQETVAIKRLKAQSSQGRGEFLTEIETLTELRHINLVSLIGYCNERKEMILVYEYMTNGTLSDHLYKLSRNYDCNSSLTWKNRLNICIGAGRGLEYLHTGHRIIHRDVKPSNILLDENFISKVADFGLAKPEDRSKLQSHVSTNVKGTFGYFDPYYISTRRLTRKSDVYAFGVVLFEVLCGRPAVDRMARENERILTKWAQNKIIKGEVNEILDTSLIGEISPGSLKAFVEVAENCLHDEPKKRPTMAQVVVKLEFALEHQERRNVYIPNQETRISDDINPFNDETKLLVGAEQVPLVYADTQTNSKIANNESPTGNRDRQKLKTNKPLRLWPWNAFWNRAVIPSKEKKLVYKTLAGKEVRRFNFESIADATNQFSFSNKIGQGGYGPVYKAVLPTGEIFAVKKFYQKYFQEFKNDILLLSNIQHRNIIRLLGYCNIGDNDMSVYEFMAKQSLDTHIYDPTQRRLLDWALRFRIITGIARGIMYLHQEMRIIHGHIYPRNILLDNEMNPKIANFCFAKTFEDDQSVTLENIIVGMVGYMAPEYFRHDGKKSVAVDIYGFGVLALETLSGKKRYPLNASDVVEYTWKLWKEGKAIDLVDDSIQGSFSPDEALRCISVVLLCTQLEPRHRPTMPHVLKMLLGEVLPNDLHDKLAEAFLHNINNINQSNGEHHLDSESAATFEYDTEELQR